MFAIPDAGSVCGIEIGHHSRAEHSELEENDAEFDITVGRQAAQQVVGEAGHAQSAAQALTGKERAVLLSQGFIGADVRANRVFSIAPNQATVMTHEFGKATEAANWITLPTGWKLSPERAVLSSDGRWIIATPGIRDRPGTLAVIDVTKRQVVHLQSMKWMITSLSLSADGKRLLVGSSNRAIYEFDFLKMTSGK